VRLGFPAKDPLFEGAGCAQSPVQSGYVTEAGDLPARRLRGAVCQTDVVPIPHGHAPGRWRYDRTVGRGIALCYDRVRFTGRWRYDRTVARGIALSYERSMGKPPPAPPARPEPAVTAQTHSPVVRVLCSCGELFSFESDEAACPRCGRLAEWPTMSVVEREMRSDLADLLRDHEQGADPDGD
jgi:hypothetical protein